MAAKKTDTTAVTVAADSDQAALAEFVKAIELVMANQVIDPNTVMGQMVADIMSAEDDDDILPSVDQATATGLRDLEGVPLKIEAVNFAQSTKAKADNPLQYFVVLHTANRGVVTCGAVKVVARALKLSMPRKDGTSRLPAYAKATVDETNGGNTVIDLRGCTAAEVSALEAALASGVQQTFGDAEPF